MKRFTLLTTILTLFICVGISSCDEDNNTSTSQSLIGSWKCIGFKENNMNTIRYIKQPKDCSECFVITFLENGTLEGRSVANGFRGEYKINDKKIIISNFGGTKVGEMGDAGIFIDEIGHINFYKFNESKLFLYTDNKVCLVFQPKTK